MASENQPDSEDDICLSDPNTHPFSVETRDHIHYLCGHRCVLCLQPVGQFGRCAHILDPSETAGGEMVTFASHVGTLEPNFDRSADHSGILLCTSCHQELLTPKLVTLSPAKEVLKYLLHHVQTRHSMPIYKVLDQLSLWTLRESSNDLPDPSHILPFLDLYTLVPLIPNVLTRTHFCPFYEPKPSRLVNGEWTTAPRNTSPDAQIYDSTVLHPKVPIQRTAVNLTEIPHERRLWYLTTRMSPILSALFHRIAHIGQSDSEEVRLAIRLRGMLVQNSAQCPDPDDGCSSPSPGGKVGNLRSGGTQNKQSVEGLKNGAQLLGNGIVNRRRKTGGVMGRRVLRNGRGMASLSPSSPFVATKAHNLLTPAPPPVPFVVNSLPVAPMRSTSHLPFVSSRFRGFVSRLVHTVL